MQRQLAGSLRLGSAGTGSVCQRLADRWFVFSASFLCLSDVSGDIHMTFTLLNATAAEAQPFGAVNVKFMAEMHNDTVRKGNRTGRTGAEEKAAGRRSGQWLLGRHSCALD